MRSRSVYIGFGLLSMLLSGLLLSASLATSPAIEAEVTIYPGVFNLKRNGVVTAHIGNLVEDGVSYDVEEINVSTIILLHGSTFIANPVYVKSSNSRLTATFDAATVANYVLIKLFHMTIDRIQPQEDYPITFTINGELLSGEEFAGSDTIQIIFP